ncbi:MAG: hypothetical protein MUF71_19000 [Candidatus Kapabacteria bacterium]|jgi:CDP-diglyceride synthetase|nr:hypothetical protein [Candidatus Kapabacteria bacterium]
MKPNKTFLALYGGITAGFFVLGMAYFIFGNGKKDSSDAVILFSIFASLLATFTALYESQRKKVSGKSQCTKNKADNDAVATFYVP